MEYERNCPECNAQIIYKSLKGFNNAVKNESVCKKCAASGDRNGMFGMVGDKNPFYGKTHTLETINKIKAVDKSYTQTKSFKQKQSENNLGEKNKMFGRSVYSVWVQKYGNVAADNKLAQLKQKHSENSRGEKNKMFGKQAPQGSGNGWSGWYKGWYFRSIRELTYMIKVIERFNLKWISGESKKYKIPYIDYKGTVRNYFPDFIISDKYIVESKPKKLWNSDTVTRKKEAAILFAEEKHLKYKLVDVGKLTDTEIKKLYDEQHIKFIERYEKLYKTKINEIIGTE